MRPFLCWYFWVVVTLIILIYVSCEKIYELFIILDKVYVDYLVFWSLAFIFDFLTIKLLISANSIGDADHMALT